MLEQDKFELCFLVLKKKAEQTKIQQSPLSPAQQPPVCPECHQHQAPLLASDAASQRCRKSHRFLLPARALSLLSRAPDRTIHYTVISTSQTNLSLFLSCFYRLCICCLKTELQASCVTTVLLTSSLSYLYKKTNLRLASV